MSRARKQRTAANTAEASSISTNEKILKECHDFYVDEEKGTVRSKQIYLGPCERGYLFYCMVGIACRDKCITYGHTHLKHFTLKQFWAEPIIIESECEEAHLYYE